MRHTTKWEPDTCSCILYFSWEDTDSEDNRTLTATEQCAPCPVHASCSSVQELLQTVQQHNREIASTREAPHEN